MRKQSPYYFSEIMREINFFEVKTTKIIKNEIESKLNNSTRRFNKSDKELLEFTLKLPTIE